MIAIPARAAVAFLVLLLAGCDYRPGADNPVARNLSWFSYARADDIRASCLPGAADRMRMIYNGDYDEQVRSYDVTALAVGGKLEIRVRGPQDLARGFLLFDAFGAWRAKGQLVRMGANQLADLRRALDGSGLTRPTPDRLRLQSREFYWLVSACLDGRFTVNAWKYPSPRFDKLSFPTVLLRLDPTGIALERPQPAGRFYETFNDRYVETGFEFKLHRNRLLDGGSAPSN